MSDEVVGASDTARRLLVLTYHYPPDGSVGGLRWAGLTKNLVPHGFASTVVTASVQPSGPGVPGVSVLACAPFPKSNDLYRWMRAPRSNVAASEAPPVAQETQSAAPKPSGILARARREASVALAMPDEGRGWILRAAFHTRSLIRAWRPDVVVSSGPPHSAHIAAWLATRGTGARWFVDLRDPWAFSINKMWETTKYFDSWFVRTLMGSMEEASIDAADRVIANTRWLADALSQKYPADKIVWLPNGFDAQSLPADRPRPFDGLGITHLGTIYGNRDLVPVVTALGAYFDKHPAARSDGTKLRVAGSIGDAQLTELRRFVRDKGLESHVEFLGVVPREKALEILLRSRLCIVLAQGQVIEIPAKIYEAIGARIPAAIVAPKGSASAAEATRIGAVFVDEHDGGALTSLFETAAKGALDVSGEQALRVSYAGVAKDFLGIVDRRPV